MDNYTNERRSNMLTKITQEFLNKKPNDEEMMDFLKEHIYTRDLFHNDILSIIERLNDEKNKHKAINRYVMSDILSLNMNRVLHIILNIKDQGISERLEKLNDNTNHKKIISKALIEYISGLEQIGECDEKTDYIDRAKESLEESVEANMIEEIDLMTFLINTDLSRWNRQDLEKYEKFLKPKNYQELMEY